MSDRVLPPETRTGILDAVGDALARGNEDLVVADRTTSLTGRRR